MASRRSLRRLNSGLFVLRCCLDTTEERLGGLRLVRLPLLLRGRHRLSRKQRLLHHLVLDVIFFAVSLRHFLSEHIVEVGVVAHDFGARLGVLIDLPFRNFLGRCSSRKNGPLADTFLQFLILLKAVLIFLVLRLESLDQIHSLFQLLTRLLKL